MGNINTKRVINYLEERIKEQNDKIFKQERNLEVLTNELNKIQHILKNQDSLTLKELSIKDKIIFIGNENNRELYLNEKDKLIQHPLSLWF